VIFCVIALQFTLRTLQFEAAFSLETLLIDELPYRIPVFLPSQSCTLQRREYRTSDTTNSFLSAAGVTLL
jgi:hypothetical protein